MVFEKIWLQLDGFRNFFLWTPKKKKKKKKIKRMEITKTENLKINSSIFRRRKVIN